jgi:hypothetical protein
LKSNLDDFQCKINSPQAFFIKNRVDINWGGFSMVQATLNGFKEILGSGKEYDFVHLLSGQDYPIKKIESIHQFLSKNLGKAFLTTMSIENEWHEAIPRLELYHFTDYRFKGASRLERIVNILLPKRKVPNGLIPVGRSQWFTISPVHVKYIVEYIEKNKNVKRFFALTWGSDEIIFHTILYNSIYQKDIINDCLMYKDWSEGKPHPKTLTVKDFPELVKSDKFFARKFDENVDKEIFNLLDDIL